MYAHGHLESSEIKMILNFLMREIPTDQFKPIEQSVLEITCDTLPIV